jgi:hypothetical protein
MAISPYIKMGLHPAFVQRALVLKGRDQPRLALCTRVESAQRENLAHGPSCAASLPHTRPRHGPGLGKSVTHLGHKSQDVHRGRSFRSDGFASNPGEQNRDPALPWETLVPFVPSPFFRHHSIAPQLEHWTERWDGGAIAGPLDGAREHRWVNAPPPSGILVVPYGSHY